MDSNLHKKVKEFRKAILSIQPDEFKFDLFSMFPVNCCEYTSLLLAKYLQEHEKIKTEIIYGENKRKRKVRHVWLRTNSLDIDITANQFNSTDRTVFVLENSEWHKKFNIIRIEIPDIKFHIYHEEARSKLAADYKAIIKNLHTNPSINRDNPKLALCPATYFKR